jgi:fructokinase
MFLVCGEALFDVYSQGEHAAGLALDARIGGSPLNVAVGLARLGAPVAFLGALSADFLGARLLQALASEGVDTRTVARVNAPATLGFVGLDAAGVPAYAFYGAGAADRALHPDALAAIDRLPAPPALIHVGSYATVTEPIAGTLRLLIEQRIEQRRGGALLACDPNVRLNVEPDLQRWRDMVTFMVRHAQLLKISEEDVGLLYPGAELAALAGDWLSQSVRLVVVTRGAAGAVAFTASNRVDVPARPAAVVDTVGAGDSFQAALLFALSRRPGWAAGAASSLDAAALRRMLEYAGHAAAITCSRRGADLPRAHELPSPD